MRPGSDWTARRKKEERTRVRTSALTGSRIYPHAHGWFLYTTPVS
jgi:hypothetical protein